MSNAALRDAPPGNLARYHVSRGLTRTRRGFDLSERLLDEALVVLTRHVLLQQLRRDGDRQVHRFLANLPHGTGRFELDLLFGVLDDAGGFGLRPLLELLPEPGRIVSRPRDDRF